MTAAAFRERYGPWAVVAGASEGIGAAYARALARRGLNLVLVARREEPLQKLAATLEAEGETRTRVHSLDLGAAEAAAELDEATDDLEVGLVVYNAAASTIGRFLETDAERHAASVAVNVAGPTALAGRFGPRLVRRGRGGLILMGSLSGFQGSPYVATYAASKAYNLVLAESLWWEWRPHGVDVLCCIAGATRTPGFEASEADVEAPALAPPMMEPGAVAEAGLAALGRKPAVITGLANRVSQLALNRLLPRRAAVSIMGRTMDGLYGGPPDPASEAENGEATPEDEKRD